MNKDSMHIGAILPRLVWAYYPLHSQDVVTRPNMLKPDTCSFRNRLSEGTWAPEAAPHAQGGTRASLFPHLGLQRLWDLPACVKFVEKLKLNHPDLSTYSEHCLSLAQHKERSMKTY